MSLPYSIHLGMKTKNLAGTRPFHSDGARADDADFADKDNECSHVEKTGCVGRERAYSVRADYAAYKRRLCVRKKINPYALASKQKRLRMAI